MDTKKLVIATCAAGVAVGALAFLYVQSKKKKAAPQKAAAHAPEGAAPAAAAGAEAPPAGAEGTPENLTAEQIQQGLQLAEHFKTQGNGFVGQKNYDEALKCYGTAIQILLPLEQVRDAAPIFLAVCSNMILVFIRTDRFDDALGLAERLLMDDIADEAMKRKITYRRGQAFAGKGEWLKAIGDYEAALRMNPDEQTKEVIENDLAKAKSHC